MYNACDGEEALLLGSESDFVLEQRSKKWK